MTDTCASCRFWDRYEGGEHSLSKKLGDCRFNPPLISDAVMRMSLPGGRCSDPFDELELTVYPASAFPVTRQNSWCGRHEEPLSRIPL